jgi:E3 ubiquitin-protein ligase RNF115/126
LLSRFSLVPAEGNGPSRRSGTGAQTTQGDNQGGQSTLTNILNRLWGQGGASSNPTSPAEDHAPSHSPFAVPAGSSTAPPSHPGDLLHGTPPPQLQTAMSPSAPRAPTSSASTSNDVASGAPAEHAPDPPEAAIPSAIPEEYRARHRQREREQHQHE